MDSTGQGSGRSNRGAGTAGATIGAATWIVGPLIVALPRWPWRWIGAAARAVAAETVGKRRIVAAVSGGASSGGGTRRGPR